MQASTLDIATMITGLGGGLALFLYGMRKMTEALKTVAGTGLKDVLARLTTNRFTGALSGALITAVIQSSSVTTVMVVGFVSAGLITFTQSIGVIMGANIGTTVTAQIVAFHIGEYSLVIIAAGFLTELLAKSQRVRHYGIALMGLGLLFFGMELMSTATAPLRSYAPFIGFLQELRTPYLGILAGVVFTAIVQSSSATTGIVIVLATQGFITLESGIALILGANVGTCITAGLSAIGRPREAVKAAAIHVVFNLVGVLLVVGFIAPFAELVRAVSTATPELSGAARLAAEVPRQIANAHTIFSIASTVVLLGFAGALGSLVERIVPRAKTVPPGEGQPVYLDPLYLDQPAVALDRVKLELERMAGITKGARARRGCTRARPWRDGRVHSFRGGWPRTPPRPAAAPPGRSRRPGRRRPIRARRAMCSPHSRAWMTARSGRRTMASSLRRTRVGSAVMPARRAPPWRRTTPRPRGGPSATSAPRP